MLRCSRLPYTCKLYFSSNVPIDPYAILEVKKDATAKDIKAAFYKLSKQYHPDTNPGEAKSSDKFQKVVDAYELIGTEDKRKAYDYSTSPRYASNLNVHTRHAHHGRPGARKKQYTDIDIDYKDFEHFQRENRRKRVFHEHWEMPNEFSPKFAGTKRDENGFASNHSNYKDSLHAKREEEELRLYKELEEMKKKAKHPLPSFEKLIQQEESNKKEKQKKAASIGVTIIMCILAIVYGLSYRR